jgi:transcriptional regulator with XRE-family HTH domain
MIPSVKTRVGQLIREARERKGFTLEKLAELSGVNLTTIQAIEVGDSRRPRESSLRALASALGPETDYATLVLATYGANGDPSPAPAERQPVG